MLEDRRVRDEKCYVYKTILPPRQLLKLSEGKEEIKAGKKKAKTKKRRNIDLDLHLHPL